MEQLDWLLNQPPFVWLDHAGRAALGARIEITYLSPGDYLGRAGQPIEAVWIVRRGAVRRHQPGPDVVIEEGELVGHHEVLDDRPLANDHEVIEALLAYLIPAPVFRQLAQHLPAGALAGRNRPDTSGLTVTAGTIAGPAQRIGSDATAGEAARMMDAAGVDALLVDFDPDREPADQGPGILTAHDLQSRVLARDLGPTTPVSQIATPRAHTIDPATPLTEALLFLIEQDVHHAPLDDGQGIRLMLSDDDILTHLGNDAFSLLRRLARDGGSTTKFEERVTRAVAGMVRSDVGPGTIGRAVSSLVDGLMRALCREAEREFGPPPAPYAFCACGSQGRREQTLLTDQDNILVHDGTEADQIWFDRLADHVVTGLIEGGIPACNGGYMATNWNGSLAWWRDQVAGWAADPDPDALLNINILADLRVVAGDLAPAQLLEPLHRAMDHPMLVRRLGAEVIRFRPPGRFSRFFGRGDDFEVKRHGLIPIVGLGRLFGLELGLSTSSTTARLEAANQANLVSDEATVWLSDGLDFLTGLRIRGQLRSLEATGDPGAEPVRRDDLDPMERSTLREVLRAVSDVQESTKDRLGLDALG